MNSPDAEQDLNTNQPDPAPSPDKSTPQTDATTDASSDAQSDAPGSSESLPRRGSDLTSLASSDNSLASPASSAPGSASLGAASPASSASDVDVSNAQPGAPGGCLPIAFTLMGAFITIAMLIGMVKASGKSSWPTAKALVTVSKQERELIEDDEQGVIGTTNSRSILRYTYTVDGKEYVGSQFGEIDIVITGNEGAEYKEGVKTIVYYNPTNPQDSLLKPGISGGMVTAFLFGIAVFTVGVLILKIHLKQKNTSAQVDSTEAKNENSTDATN